MSTVRRSGPASHVPWNAHDEKWTRRIVHLDWYLMLLGVIATPPFLWFRLWGTALACFAIAVLAAIDGTIQFTKLQALLENKPRSVDGLTQWIQLRPWQTEICCACGVVVHIHQAPWYPNPVDPGGGRFAIVCPCGIGYFKLRDSRPVEGVP